MNNPLKVLSSREKVMWLISVNIVVVSNFFAKELDPLTLIAVTVGVTSLIFAAKGHVIAQVLMILFSILYAVISFRFRYWGRNDHLSWHESSYGNLVAYCLVPKSLCWK